MLLTGYDVWHCREYTRYQMPSRYICKLMMAEHCRFYCDSVVIMLMLLQDIGVGTGHGVLLSDPDAHNVAVGCNVTSRCESHSASLCPGDRSTCISSWNASSCLCHPGMSSIARVLV